MVRWAPIDDGRGPRPVPKFVRVDLFVAIGEALPFALYHHTGSKNYNIRTRALAKRKGWLLNQYGLFDRKTGKRLPGTSDFRTEKDITDFLGVTYRGPTDRE